MKCTHVCHFSLYFFPKLLFVNVLETMDRDCDCLAFLPSTQDLMFYVLMVCLVCDVVHLQLYISSCVLIENDTVSCPCHLSKFHRTHDSRVGTPSEAAIRSCSSAMRCSAYCFTRPSALDFVTCNQHILLTKSVSAWSSTSAGYLQVSDAVAYVKAHTAQATVKL